jgi:hypothetical protein
VDTTHPVASWARNIATTWKTTATSKKAKMTLAKAISDFTLNS